MKSFIVKCDDVRETDSSIGLPVGEHGHAPIKYHIWAPISECKIQDRGLYYVVSVKEKYLAELVDSDKIITHVPL